jgi:hypothetical protein
MKTAVEWLEKEFVKLEVTIGVHGVMYEIIEQAKEMEKQQIMDAANKLLYHSTGPSDTAAEQYYNETFKKD